MGKKLLTLMSRFASKSILFSFLFVAVTSVTFAQTTPTISYSPNSGIAYLLQPQNSVAPTVNDGGSAVTYSLSSNPSGVTINANTGQISWDATVAVGTYNLTITATNSFGTSNATYSLRVIPNPNDYFSVKYSASPATTVQYGASTAYNNVDVYLPNGDAHTQRPVLMFLHGGGFQTSGTKTESYVVSFCKYFATLGFVCFAPNYNEGGGHTAAQNLKALKDADSCLKWIRNPTTAAKYHYDPRSLYFGGGSAGAHLSCNFAFADGNSWYSGFTPSITDVIAFADCWGSSPVMSSSGSGDRLYNFANLNANSLPAYMVQGSADQTVPVSNGIDLSNALTAVGALHDWWEIPGETHGCPSHIAAISDSMKTFFKKIWISKFPQTVNAIVTPVKLVSFGATTANGVVNLDWTTASEINAAYFEVERSLDGLTFVSLGSIAAKGNSSASQSYSFTDPFSILTGTVYYRLKSVDKDGSFSYSSVKSVDISTATEGLSVYPNPINTGNDLQLKYNSSNSEQVTIQLVNVLGKQLINTVQTVNKGNNALTLSVGHLKAGTYYLSVINKESLIRRSTVIVK